VPPVKIGTKEDVPDPVIKPVLTAENSTLLGVTLTVKPVPAENVLYVSAVPAELEDKKAFPDVIEVSPVPPPEVLKVLNDFHAVPSHLQDFPFAVKIWFSVGDVGKLSAAIKKPKDFFSFLLFIRY
jgi:hypothetical protein